MIWACDFLQTYGALFRSIFVFVIIELESRWVVHVNVTRHPTDAWVAQQLLEVTPFGEGPRFLIRDNDKKYGGQFQHVVDGANIEIVKTPVEAPRANAFCERFLGSLRRECLDHVIVSVSVTGSDWCGNMLTTLITSIPIKASDAFLIR